MTMRLSINSLAGIARTLVAVGTSSDADMFLTTAAAAPRSTCTWSPSAGATVAGFAGAVGKGAPLLSVGFAGASRGVGGVLGAGVGGAGAADALGDPSVAVGASAVGSGL